MYTNAERLHPPQLDYATFIGPVAIKDSGISPGGRGLFTTKAVSAGDLLFCEKAFAHAFVDESASERRGIKTTILIDPISDRVSLGTELELTNMIVQKLHRNPSLASSIIDLHHGSYEPASVVSVDGTPIIDTFLIRRMIALNSFGCPLSSRESHLFLGSAPDKSATTHPCLG